MASDSFLIRIITPAGLQIEERVTAVTLPAADGEVGLLPGHVSYTNLIGAGVMQFTPVLSEQIRKAVISGGFANYSEDILTVLADSLDLPENIDLAWCHTRRAELQKELRELNSYDAAWEVASLQLRRVEAMESLAQR